MKKFILFLCFSLISVIVFSQTPVSKGLQKVTMGGILAVSGNTPINTPIKPFTLGYEFFASTHFVTPKTYHNLLYGMKNSLKLINGYKPKEELGIYIALQKSLNSNTGYAGVGAERFLKITDKVTFFLFSEVGASLKSNSKPIPIFTLGTHFNLQPPVWKRKL